MGIDIAIVNPGDRKQVYQGLSNGLSAVEPPYLAASMAAYLGGLGFSAEVLDANALELTPAETASRVREMAPLLAAVLVYGHQPSASTQNMTIAGKVCRALREEGVLTALGGLHPSALPKRTMEEEAAHMVIEGEGQYTVTELLSALKSGARDYSSIPGLWWRDGGGVRHNLPAPLIADLDRAMPIAAWDSLPMERYRAHNWHCFDSPGKRSPYAAVYTSLGCPWSCVFCCINAQFGRPGIRYRSPRLVADEIGVLHERHGVENLKIMDELFVLDERHYMEILRLIRGRGYKLNIWAYARVDTVKRENLGFMKRAGVNWLALGIESADPGVRDGAAKRLRARDIKSVVRAIQDEGIRVIGNYIFGLPDDTAGTMRETLEMAKDLRTEFANFYCAMAYPGSKLYKLAIEDKRALPGEWHGFSQHSYEVVPLSTRHLSAREVLEFRDNAFHDYFEDPAYLDMVDRVFGSGVREGIIEMTGTRLGRKLLEANNYAGGAD